jgi:hypothetical protein
MNGGQTVPMGAVTANLLGLWRATARRNIEMRKQLIIRCSIKVDFAACLRAVAVFVYLLT